MNPNEIEVLSDGSVDCDANGTNCICKHGFDGSKCERCKEGFTGNPNEIKVQTNNFVEVSAAARVHTNVNFQKFLKYIIGLGVLLFVLILVVSMTFLNNDESETLKQCLPGYYKFPDCIRKSTNQPIGIFL